MKLTRFKLAFLSYALFDLLIGGHCGGLLPLEQLAAAQQSQAVGNITSAATTCSTTAVPTNCVILQLDGSTGAASIDISGTWAATLQIEAFGGVTWAAINCTPPNSTTAVSSTTANGVWQCNVAGFSSIRVRASAYTSGTAAVVINSAHASAKSGGGTSLPALSDNGTVVTSTEVFRGPDGTAAAPTYSFTSATGVGMANVSGTLDLMSTTAAWQSLGAGLLQWPSGMVIGWSSGTTINSTASDAAIRRRGAANYQFGAAADVNGVPVDQTISVQNAITGTDLTGAHFTIDAPLGTGLGAGSKTCINRGLMGSASGATAQTSINGFCVGESKKLSNTSATAQSLANISVPSNSAGGASGFITITCTDGTNFDSETQSFNVSYVNKATVLTVGTPAITASTAANNSGSCTAGITAVAGTNSVDIKVTPVFTTIVPTIVTSYIELMNHGAGNVTIN